MNDKTICKSVKDKTIDGIFKAILVILFIALVISLIVGYNQASGDLYYGRLSYDYFVTSTVFGGLLFVVGVLYIALTFTSIEVTENKVFGRTVFGKQVDLPISQISAVGLSLFKGMSVSTSSGRVKFYLIGNRNEVYQTLSAVLIKRQNETKIVTSNTVVAPQSNAEELKKYKELLDSGIISQQEYDAKKQQLLGL